MKFNFDRFCLIFLPKVYFVRFGIIFKDGQTVHSVKGRYFSSSLEWRSDLWTANLSLVLGEYGKCGISAVNWVTNVDTTLILTLGDFRLLKTALIALIC